MLDNTDSILAQTSRFSNKSQSAEKSDETLLEIAFLHLLP